MVSNYAFDDNLFKESLNLIETPIVILSREAEVVFINSVCEQLGDCEVLLERVRKLLLDQKGLELFNYEITINSSIYNLKFRQLEKQGYYLLNIGTSAKNNDFVEIVEYAHNAILKIDPEGRITYINHFGKELLGYATNEIIGQEAIGKIFHEAGNTGGEENKSLEGLLEKVLKNELVEIENLTKDGRRLWMSWTTRVVKDQSGNIIEFIAVGTDRTEKKYIKEQLQESEDRFRRMFEQSSLGIYQTTREGQIIKVNESFVRLFGFNSVNQMLAEVKDIPKQLYVNPSDREKLLESLEKKPEKSTVQEVRFKKRGGTIFMGYLHLRKVVDAKSKNFFYEGYVEDITDRKSAELALQYSRNKYKHLVETIPYGINEVDLNGFITYCNSPFEKMLGYSPGELLGKHIADLKPHKYKSVKAGFLESIPKNSSKPERVFDKIVTKQGNTLDIQVDWDYLHDENKKVIGFFNVISDITEQKASANALKESENRFRGIYENSTIGIYRTSLDGEILMANPIMCKLFGYSSFNEFKQLNASDFYLHPEDRKQFVEKINTNGFVNGYETRGRKKDGSMLYFRVSARAVENEKGEVIYYDGILEDYTEKKLMEQNLIKAKEEAEKADRLKSAFLANMSHEVRTPMNGIMGFSNLLRQPGLSHEQQMRYTNIIQSRGEDLLRIINDILDISKLEVSQLKLHEKEFSLNDLMKQLYEIYKQKIKNQDKSNMEIRLKMNCLDENYVLKGDETRIKQIITNFADNAIKFTEKGFVEIGCEIQNKETVHFYVKDTGIGVPDEMKELIFERFRQNDETLTRNYGGNGLGLAICRGLANLMNGNVGVTSKVNEGSIFYFNMPANFVKKQLETKIDDLDSKYYWPKKRILVVEDDDVSSVLIEEYFETTKALVRIVIDGYSALRMLREDKNFDLVLLDIQLPDISGYEVAKQIKKFYPKIPIIAQTAFAMMEDETKCKKVGCEGYLKKPIIKDKLLETVNKFLT